MADSDLEKSSLGSPLAPIVMCETHEQPIDMVCEDCDEFICAKCAKTDHRDHDWNTIPTAATHRRRGLPTFLNKIKEKELPGIDEKIKKILQQVTENTELCDADIEKLQKHVDEIIARLIKIRKRHEQTIRDNLVEKNDQLNQVKSELEKKKKGITDTVEFIENNSTMSDYSLIDNHRELTKMLSELEVHTTDCEHSVRFTRGEIKDDLVESLIGKTLHLDSITVTQTNSFQYGDKSISILEAFSEVQCYISNALSKYTEKVDNNGAIRHRYSINPYDMCMTGNSDVYFTDYINKSIALLSTSGSVSTVISTDPLGPYGICQSVDGGLLVTLKDNESDYYKLKPQSIRLVRHITVTGDVIHEYEYQEDGHTRLFTLPVRVTQNSNSDICVVNRTNENTGELVIMSPSGRMKSVYSRQNLKEDFKPTDVVCDSFCNILVTDHNNKQIHLLSPDVEFLKFLLMQNEVHHPFRISLYKSTLWVGYYGRCIKSGIDVVKDSSRTGRPKQLAVTDGNVAAVKKLWSSCANSNSASRSISGQFYKINVQKKIKKVYEKERPKTVLKNMKIIHDNTPAHK
ncbi:uncharacterized protein LOC134235280, partial [Saccostrea cucullata]|uniref:uncharacterized protein LOC134235280 n=1 Tax=Saccostrea cuccullata TaxID=36930 RepID=UPI002ED21872